VYSSSCSPVALQDLTASAVLPREHGPGLPAAAAQSEVGPREEVGNVAEHCHPTAPVLCAQPQGASRSDSAGA
jgi:hypothetical protein